MEACKEEKKDKDIKKPKKFAKLLFGLFVLAIFAFIVTATVITYFGKMQQQVTVNKAVVMSGEGCDEDGICTPADPISGGQPTISPEYTLQSQTSVDVPIKLVTTIDPDEPGIETMYYGELMLSQKVVVFGANHWALTGDKATVKYSFVDDEFTAEVTEGEKEGYVLIYYKDNSDRFANPAAAIRIEDVTGDLPYDTDGNKEEYSYCGEEEDYETCHGAKIWYVPSTAINADGSLDWSKASDFLYETKLIKYFDNSDNLIIVSPDDVLRYFTETTFDVSNTGSYTITTEAQVQ